MKKSKMTLICNLFLILYPVLLMLFIACSNVLNQKMMRYELHPAAFAALYLAYFCILLLFLYCFLIRQVDFHFTALLLGTVEIVLLHIPQVSVQALAKIATMKTVALFYTGLQLHIFLFGTFLCLYITLFLAKWNAGKKEV